MRNSDFPVDLLESMNSNIKAKKIFEELSISHKNEYINWINEAKKEETRKKRILKTIEMLLKRKT